MEWVKILSGAQSARMLNREYRNYVDLVIADVCPGDGYHRVEKVLPKPTPAEGEELGYTYTVRDGVAYKEYFVARLPRVFSKLSLEDALFKAGVLDRVDAFIDSQTVTNEFGQTMPLRRKYTTANEFSEGHPLFVQFKGALQGLLGWTDERVEALLAKCAKE